MTLSTLQVFTTTDGHQDIIARKNITHADIIISATTADIKRDKNVRDFDTVNKHIADASAMQ